MQAKKIVVVEDDDTIRELYVEILTEEGFEAIPARNGREALEVLASSSEAPSLLLTDFLMPEMNGGEMIEQLVKENKLQFPVLMVSATLNSLKVCGYDIDFLRKPTNVDELLYRVHKHCGPTLPTPSIH